MRTLAFALSLFAAASLAAAPVRIGVLLKDRDLFWTAAEKGALQAARDTGVEVIVKAPIVPNSLPQQAAMLEALAKEPLDALVIAPLSEDAFKTQLQALVTRGVKIVALDTPLPAGLAHAYVGYNQVTMGEDAARAFAGLIGETDAAAVLRANSVEGMSVREKTVIATFKKERPKATLHLDVLAGAERQDDFAKSTVLLEKHPDVKAVFTPFSASTLGMTKAIQARGLAGKVQHAGFSSSLPDELVAAIQTGALQVCIVQQPHLIGSKGVEIAAQLVQGKTVNATNDVPYLVVTKANLNDAAVKALQAK